MVQAMYDEGLKPGDRYLTEAEGMSTYGVGRGTYREAIRFLELHGVIVMRSGPTGGVEVSQPDWHHLASTIALLMQFADAPLGSILEARIAIDPGMAELAARTATDSDIADMATQVTLIAASVGKYKAWNAAYNAYWATLAASTHNPLLASLSPALRAIVNSGGFVPNELFRIEIGERLNVLHRAIAARDPNAARDAMSGIDRSIQRRLSDGYPRQFDRVVCWPDIQPTTTASSATR